VSDLIISNIALDGLLAGLASALVFYAFLRRASYSLLDPLLLVGVFVPLSAAFLAVLCATRIVPWDKFLLFTIVLFGYLVGARISTTFFRLERFRQALNDAVASFRRGEILTILVVTVLLTVPLAVLGLTHGASGDARQEFAREFRPLIVLQSGLLLFSVTLLLSRRFNTAQVATFMVTIIALSVPFSGKSILLPIVYFYGLRLFATGRRPSVRVLVVMGSLALIGAALMGLIAYRAGGVLGLYGLIVGRFWASGDVYVLAYEAGGLDYIRGNYHVAFIPYMLHPFTDLVGVRAYDRPLGGMLASAVVGYDVVTGPNPQLPVLLDFFFPHSLIEPFLVALVIGFLVLALRPLALLCSRARGRFVKLGGVVAAVFCPAAGFFDASLVSISLIGVVGVTVFGTAVELLYGRRSHVASPPFPAQTYASRSR